MILVVIVGAVVALVLFPTFRCAVLHPFLLVWSGARDLFFYFKHKKYNLCPSGELVAYTGLFGRGKTLSAVHKVVCSYRRYNGKKVWCSRRQQLVTQRIKVISNVSLSIPYENLVSLEQIVLAAERNQEYDNEHGTLTVTLVLGDEFSVQMNSRNFKTNIDPLFLNTILTCRHYYISLYYTAQRFGHVDALLRQVTSYVIECSKLWRLQRLSLFDAWELENAANPRLLTPLNKNCWFVRDRDYNAYDTLACVGNLKKSMKQGDMMSEDEILKPISSRHFRSAIVRTAALLPLQPTIKSISLCPSSSRLLICSGRISMDGSDGCGVRGSFRSPDGFLRPFSIRSLFVSFRKIRLSM